MAAVNPCASCGGCGSGTLCGGCGGCSGTLYLTETEAEILRRFGEVPFWPLIRRAEAEEASCPEAGMDGAALKGLSLKGLIRLDEDLPLTNYAYSGVPPTAHRGSMALTAAGQRVLDLLDIQGMELEE